MDSSVPLNQEPVTCSPVQERGDGPPSVHRPRRAATTGSVPPRHDNRTLIICFDGTGDAYDADNSNVVKFCELLKKDDGEQQLVYYQSGIGTYTIPNYMTPVISGVSKVLDQMIAWNLDTHVQNGYEFLMQTYRPHDNICIFGFSRGAYAARSLAGMLHKVGLLPPHNFQQVPFAYQMFIRDDPIGWAQSYAFRRAFCREVEIEFMGVWDTVCSVGIIPRKLPFTTSNTLVRTFRHALALDERRAKFKANTWNRPTEVDTKMATPPPTRAGTFSYLQRTYGKGKNSAAGKSSLPAMFMNSANGDTLVRNSESSAPEKICKEDSTHEAIPDALEQYFDDTASHGSMDVQHVFEQVFSQPGKHDKPTDIEEVWFAGTHCDVGGGSVKNETPHSLARISLRWMIRECFKTNSGIMFDADRLRGIGLDPDSLYPHVAPRPAPELLDKHASLRSKPQPTSTWTGSLFRSSRKIEIPLTPTSPESTCVHGYFGDLLEGTEEGEDLLDCLEPTYDQLELRKGWWILELLPLTFKVQLLNNEWKQWRGLNFGRPREVPEEAQKEQGIKVHRTVKMRMDAAPSPGSSKRYTPRVKFFVEPTWVD